MGFPLYFLYLRFYSKFCTGFKDTKRKTNVGKLSVIVSTTLVIIYVEHYMVNGGSEWVFKMAATPQPTTGGFKALER